MERRQSRYGHERLTDLMKAALGMLVTGSLLLVYELVTDRSSVDTLLSIMILPAAAVMALELYALARRTRH